MAIAISIGISLIVGVTAMFNNKSFWGKEENPNINYINSTITDFNSVFNIAPVVILLVAVLGIVMYVCTMRGF